jgi:hypothetical protein
MVAGPDRLGLIVRFAGVCIAAMILAALAGTVSFDSRPTLSGVAARRATTWANIPLAAREVISRDIGHDQSRFAVTHSGGHLVANGLGISTRFGRRGIAVRSGSGLSLELGLEAIGREGSLTRIDPTAPTGSSNTINYNHPGIDERYVNGPLGLEQSFAVDHRMNGTGELTLVVGRVPAGSKSAVSAGGASLTIMAARGHSLRYSGLTVTDATGHHVSARITVSGSRILLEISDARARYPLRVDPTVYETGGAQLAESDAGSFSGDDYFGYSVAISADGGTVVVGVPAWLFNSEGAAFVFTEPPSGGWQSATQTAILTPSDGTYGAGIGSSVSVSGDGSTIVVGAPGQNVGSVDRAGAAYVFNEPASGGWQNATEAAELTAGDAVAGDRFGTSVAISEDGHMVAAGAPNHAVNGTAAQGAAYVFTEPLTGGWQAATQTAELTSSDGAQSDLFGTSIGVSGDGGTVVVGAPGHVALGPGAPGEAYVFTEPASGGWQSTTETAQLTPTTGSLPQSGVLVFGSYVAISADESTIAVASPETALGPGDGPGQAYVFSKPVSGGWQDATETAVLTGTYVGVSQGQVAVSEDGSVIAATDGEVNLGTAKVFDEPASGGWQNTDTPDGTLRGTNTARIGQSLAISGDGRTVVSGGTASYGSVAVFPEIPAELSPPVVSGQYFQGETVAETHGAWSSNPTTYSYQWEDCDSTAHSCSPIGGATGQSYILTTSDVGSTIEVQETATNVSGYGSPASSAATQVVQPLAATSAPTISGQVLQGQTLTETHGVWNTTVTGYSYQWERCGASGGGCSAIAGATGPSYTLTNADAGHTIVVQEGASNAGGAGIPSRSAPTGVVTPLAPTSSAVPTISGTAVEGNTLTASLLAWTNTPSSVSYQWEDCDSNGQNCRAITGATSKTYMLAASDIGSRVAVEESASNAGGPSAPATSAATGAVPESGPVGLEIDNGDYATNDPNVTIQAAWLPGTQSILVSNNGGFRTDVHSFAPAATINWKLEQTGNDRLSKTVYVRFLGVGQDDINFTDDIILDELAPTVQSAAVTGPGTARASAARAAKIKTYKLRLKAEDKVVGVCEVAVSQTRSSRGEDLVSLASCKARSLLKVSRSLQLKLSGRPRFVRVLNSAGDWSRWTAVK